MSGLSDVAAARAAKPAIAFTVASEAEFFISIWASPADYSAIDLFGAMKRAHIYCDHQTIRFERAICAADRSTWRGTRRDQNRHHATKSSAERSFGRRFHRSRRLGNQLLLPLGKG